MKFANLLPISCLLALAACSGESQFPEPTGKGTFRSINAISTSPTMNFRLEEVGGAQVQQAAYREVTPAQRFDDFEYNFNFEVSFPGELQPQRVATVTQKIEADRDFTFVMTGAVESPTILTWVGNERIFDDTETVTEIRFAHLAESVGTVDFFFAVPNTPPTAGAEQGTLEYGEFLEGGDFEGDVYVLTVTPAGDPNTILYQSIPASFGSRTISFAAIFDGTADDTSTIVGRRLGIQGSSSATLRDVRLKSALRIVQGSQTLGTVDVYADEMLQNQVVAALPFQGTSEEFEIVEGESSYRYTPAGSTGAVLLESSLISNGGRRYEQYALGSTDTLLSISNPRDTQPVEIYATLSVTNTLEDEQIVDVYVVPPGEDIAEQTADFSSLYGFVSGRFRLVAGIYEVIVTADESKTPLATTRIDVANGGVERFTLFATADPNVAALLPQP